MLIRNSDSIGMWLQVRMFLLVALLFGIVYGVIVGVGTYLGVGGAIPYLILALVFIGIQYLIAPSIVSSTMRIRWVSEREEPKLHRIMDELARNAGLPKPRIGISQISIPNAFAFGRSTRDARVCVTQGILNLLDENELEAVLGHEISHIKHRDMQIITFLSAIPLMLYFLAWSLLWGGAFARRGGGAALLGLGAFVLYFVTNLLVLYGSRIREYFADLGSVKLGALPHHLASALYKLVHASARYHGGDELKRIEGNKAFFINDPSRALGEIRELSEIDRDMSGTIDEWELAEIRNKKVVLSRTEKMMELLSTHPNMLKRIKHLSSIA
jgi:heat shock protein HtpX